MRFAALGRPLLVPDDSQETLTEYVRSILPRLTGPGWSVGTRVKSGTTPARFIQVRGLTITHEQPPQQLHQVDFLVWHDGTTATEQERIRIGRTLYAFLRQRFTAHLVNLQPTVSDPVDPDKRLTLLTVSLLLNAKQL